VSPVPRRRQYYEGATTSHPRATHSLMISVVGPTRSSRLCARRSAPAERGGRSQAWDLVQPAIPVPGMAHPWARVGSLRFPGAPSYAFALLQDPGRVGKTSPLAVSPMLPPDPTRRRPPLSHDFEAGTGLQHPLSTLQERRRRRPRKTRFRLAGCAFAGRGSNPLDRVERFPVTSFLLPRTFPDASWAAR